MNFSQITFVFLLCVTVGTRLGLAQTPPLPQNQERSDARAKEAEHCAKSVERNAQAEKVVAEVSAPSQSPKSIKMILEREGELYRIYRRETKAEAKAAAELEMARQAEIEDEKSRLVKLLLAHQSEVEQEELRRADQAAQLAAAAEAGTKEVIVQAELQQGTEAE